MFKIAEDNAIVGKYLGKLIDTQYGSRREFGRQYLIAAGNPEPTVEETNNMANRLSQIINGNKGIQTRDLPFFTKMLGVSCEQILSAGEYCVPLQSRVTNYAIACSKDPKEWEEYIHREDKLILNTDEYCKTVLDYALEFRNYEFIKYLMAHQYIWFASEEQQDYVFTFGAGTSIERRHISAVDYGLEGKLKTEDKLRLELIALACDNEDLPMLEKLHARENPQLYNRAHFIFGQHPDFDHGYNEKMVKHIANSSESILDYFTSPFTIPDSINYKDGSKRFHTFVFPYISNLIDYLIINQSSFAETAIKKAIRHNNKTYEKLCELILSVKNDPCYSPDYMKHMWIKTCKQYLDFFENGNIVMFCAFYSQLNTGKQIDGIVTNIVRASKTPKSPILKQLVEELNESYRKIENLKEYLEEI